MNLPTNIDKRLSFTSASSLPMKLVSNGEFMTRVHSTGRIYAYHIQLCPTNRCNLKCSFCSCSSRDKSEELPFRDIKSSMSTLYNMRCRAVTITGGGEPLLHPNINEIIKLFDYNGIKVGLVTNGIELGSLANHVPVYWCRISGSDNRKPNFKELAKQINRPVSASWAFSYVVGESPDIDNLVHHIEFANSHFFSHVRVVSDLLQPERVNMASIESTIHSMVDDSKVIYQPRDNYTRGAKECWLSLLKPVIAANGNIYPCCGAQYAEKEMSLNYGQTMVMGVIKDIRKIYLAQIPFDGSRCERCYYSNYNKMLDAIKHKPAHIEWL